MTSEVTICTITDKISLKFGKLAFLWVSDQAVYNFV